MFFEVSCIVVCSDVLRIILSSLLVAPPLTSDVLLPLLKGVKSWRKLAKQLLYASYKDGPKWLLPPGYSQHNLDDLQCQRRSDEDCLNAVIEIFLQGRGQYEQPSWGAVLHSLYNANELQPAASIKSYAEPQQGVHIILLMDIVK